jgi:hypothetical protein
MWPQQSLKIERKYMKKLRDDDYLIELTIRVAVRKQDVAALLSQADIPPSDDDSEQDRVLIAVSDLVDDTISNHDCLDFSASSAWRMPNVKAFNNFEPLEEDLAPGANHRTHKNELQSPVSEKRNQEGEVDGA